MEVEWMGDLYLCMMDPVNLYVNVERKKKYIIINVEIKLIVLFYPFYYFFGVSFRVRTSGSTCQLLFL